MRFPLFLFLLLCFATHQGQTDSLNWYTPPKYIGSSKGILPFIDSFIQYHYPKNESELSREATVSAITFISKEGKVRSVNAIGPNKGFNAAAKTIMLLSGSWQPAMRRGVPFDTSVVQRFLFSPDTSKFGKDSLAYETSYRMGPATAAEIAKWENDDRLNRENKKNWKPFQEKGLDAFDKGDFHGAIDLFLQSYEKGSPRVELYYYLSVTWYNLKLPEKACPWSRQAALRGNPEAFDDYNKNCR